MKAKGSVVEAEIYSRLDNVLVQFIKDDKVIKDYQITGGEFDLTYKDEVDSVIFAKDGFWTKKYDIENIPSKIVLLSKRIIGYQDKLWFQSGDEIICRVNASYKYKAILYRYGFEKDPIFTLDGLTPVSKSVPDDIDIVEVGLNWDESFRYTLPQDIKPGIYGMQLESEDGDVFTIPMIVSTSKKEYGKKTKILVLGSNTTWQSYNTWGGRSRYRNFQEEVSNDFMNIPMNSLQHLKNQIKKKTPASIKQGVRKLLNKQITPNDWMFKPLSIKRPFINCALEGDTVIEPFSNHLAAGEWRVLAWLERENFEYDFISGYELHKNGELLKNYDTIIFSTHCEYWTKEMYNSLKVAHQKNKLWIVNLSGNSIFREIEFLNDDGETRCTSLFFEKSCCDETELVGVRFSDDDYGTAAPYKVLKKDHWCFYGTVINEINNTFGHFSLNQNTPRKSYRYDPGRSGSAIGLMGHGASGWETDKLSKTALKETTIIAKGQNKKGGADMVLREQKGSRGGLFSASSITFGGSLLIDYTSSQIVKNVLNKIQEIR